MRLFLRSFFFGFGFIIGGALMLLWLGRGPYDTPQPRKQWGVTFAIPYAEQLGLAWQEAFISVLDELLVRDLRIPVYWQIIEPEKGQFDFSSIDWQLEEARKREARVILAIGRKLPRWPECHVPGWAKLLPEQQQQEEILRALEATVDHYKNAPALWAWQIENEPFVTFFGKCPKPDENFLAKEFALVRQLDPARPIISTDSGGFSLWFAEAKYGDIFGTTMYRIVPSINQKSFSVWKVPQDFYNKKANLLQKIVPVQDIMVIELQTEAWAQLKPIQELTIEEQYASMSPQFFRETIKYVQGTGFKKVYLWGVEWWYWLKLRGHPEIWDEAKTLFHKL